MRGCTVVPLSGIAPANTSATCGRPQFYPPPHDIRRKMWAHTGDSVYRILIYMQQRRIERITNVINNRQSGVIVVLEDIHDPHNAAAILRTCDAMGIQHVWFIFEKEASYNPKRIGKATSSSANKWLDFKTFSSSLACIEALKKEEYRIVVSSLSDTAVSLERYHDPKTPIALVVGNEHAGVSDTMLKNADVVLKIPMQGFVQSLNVSVAAAILLWEITNQRVHSGRPLKLSPNAQQALLEDLLERAKK